jgi:AraC-like DNA-binding protein
MEKVDRRHIRDRLVFDLADLDMPEVPLLGIHNAPSVNIYLADHVHTGLMEICYLRRGEESFHVGGQDYKLKGGDVFFTFPDENHGTGSKPQGKGLLYWTQIQLNAPRFLGLTPAMAEPLINSLLAMPERKFRGDKQLGVLFEEMIDLCLAPRDALTALRVAHRLAAWLVLIAESARRGSHSRYSEDITSVIAWMSRHVCEPIDIDAVARSANLSVSWFKAKFKEQVGMGPGEYMMRLKIQQAQQWLEEGRDTITQIAHRLGFSSSQYFATVFKRFTGQQAGQIKKLYRPSRAK